MKKTADFRSTDRLLVLRQNAKPASETDWSNFLRELVRLRPRFAEMAALVVTDGGGPTVDQRKQLTKVMNGATIQTAVVTDALSVRFVVSSVALFNKTIRTFSRSELPLAYAWLKLPKSDIAKMERMIAELDESVGESTLSI